MDLDVNELVLTIVHQAHAARHIDEHVRLQELELNALRTRVEAMEAQLAPPAPAEGDGA